MLEELTLSKKTPITAALNAQTAMRHKFLAAIDTQIAAAEAQTENRPFVRLGKRWLSDGESGERVQKEVPLRFLPWWWRDETGMVMLTLRYGSRPIELRPGKPTIEIGDESNLLPTLKLIREAAALGELDSMLVTAKPRRRRC